MKVKVYEAWNGHQHLVSKLRSPVLAPLEHSIQSVNFSKAAAKAEVPHHSIEHSIALSDNM